MKVRCDLFFKSSRRIPCRTCAGSWENCIMWKQPHILTWWTTEWIKMSAFFYRIYRNSFGWDRLSLLIMYSTLVFLFKYIVQIYKTKNGQTSNTARVCLWKVVWMWSSLQAQDVLSLMLRTDWTCKTCTFLHHRIRLTWYKCRYTRQPRNNPHQIRALFPPGFIHHLCPYLIRHSFFPPQRRSSSCSSVHETRPWLKMAKRTAPPRFKLSKTHFIRPHISRH